MRHSSRALVSTIAVVVACGVPTTASAADFTEGFDTVVPAGWTATNLSSPVGSSTWFQGSTAVFPAHQGAANAYAGANFNSTGSTGTISNWLISPQVTTLTNGDTFSFFSRKADPDTFPDRLELRLSTNGSCSPGASATSTGDFSELLLTINPTLITGVYPTAWTQFSATVSGLPGTASGCFAFRYDVTGAGSAGANSDYIGIDTVAFTEDVAAPGVPTVLATTPLSPSNDNSPEVTGSGAEAGSTVKIYDNDTCTGTPLGSGNAADFNGATGVTATVPSDSTTFLSASVTDGSNNVSACSTTFVVYVEDSTAPAPTITATTPASPSNDNDPEVKGSGAETGFTVSIYDNAGCTGTPLGSGTATDFNGASGVTASVPSDATTVLHARSADSAGNVGCSPGFAYTEDSSSPTPTITATTPASPANDNDPEVKGSGAETGFTVSIYDNAGCTGTPLGSGTATDFNGASGVTASVPSDATTVLHARSADSAGNVGCSPGFAYTEDSSSPTPTITATTPASPANDNTPEVKGSGVEPGATVSIYDNATCTGPAIGTGTAADFNGATGITATVPGDATTSLRAKAVDALGNQSSCSAGFAYTEDSSSPTPTITATTPTSPANDNNPEVRGSGAEAGSTVSIYDNAACTGAPVGSGTAADFNGAVGITATVPDNATTNLHAEAEDALLNPSGCSAAFAYTENSRVDPPSNKFTFGAVTLNKKKGTATLAVEIPGPGKVALSGAAVKAQEVAGAGPAVLNVIPTGKVKKKLKKRGKAKVPVTVTFTPTGGTPSSQDTELKLKRKR